MSGQVEPDYLCTRAALLEFLVHHSPKNMERKRRLHSWVFLQFLGEDRSIQSTRLGERSLKRKWCVSNETPTFSKVGVLAISESNGLL